MLTLFALPKAFKGHFGIIQKNAIKSWTLLEPAPQVILFGKDEGIAEVARELGVTHIPEVKCNEYGTPLLNAAFAEAEKKSSNPIMCYANADVIFLSDFIPALQEVQKTFPKFLLFSQRWDTPITEPYPFDEKDWEKKLREWAIRERPPGQLWGLADYFVYPRGTITEMPPLAIGRTAFDNWILFRARELRVPVINATGKIFVVHQKHDYSHHPENAKGVWNGVEAQSNRKLAGEKEVLDFGLHDATHLFDEQGLREVSGREYLWRRIASSPVLYPRLTPLKWVFRGGALARKVVVRIPTAHITLKNRFFRKAG